MKDEVKTQLKRVEYWNNLYNSAIKAEIPNHKDILLALEKSRSLIKPEYWHLLSDVKASL